MFVLSTFDLDSLRAKYRLTATDSSPSVTQRLPRRFMIEAIIIREFGEEKLIKYKTNIKYWDETEQQVKQWLEHSV